MLSNRIVINFRSQMLIALVVFAMTSACHAGGDPWTWDGGGGNSFWHTAANWDNQMMPNTVPPSGADVVIDTGATVVIATAGGTNVTVGTLAVTGGSTVVVQEPRGLHVEISAGIQNLRLEPGQSATIGGSPGAIITITGHLDAVGGFIGLGGAAFVIAPNAIADIHPDPSSPSVGISTLENRGQTFITGPGTLNLAGVGLHNVGPPDGKNPPTVTLEGGIFINWFDGAPQFVNDGLLQTVANGGYAGHIEAILRQKGRIEVNPGSALSIQHGSASEDNLIHVHGGGTLGVNFTLSPPGGSTFTQQSGLLDVDQGGLMTFFASTSLNLNGDVDIDGTLNVSPNCNLGLNGPTKYVHTFNAHGALVWGNATLQVPVDGSMVWTDGELAVPIECNGTLQIKPCENGTNTKRFVVGPLVINGPGTVSGPLGAGTPLEGIQFNNSGPFNATIDIGPKGSLTFERPLHLQGHVPSEQLCKVRNYGTLTINPLVYGGCNMSFENYGNANIFGTLSIGGPNPGAQGTQFAGVTWLPSGGLIGSTQPFILQGGVLRGNGQIGSLNNVGGTVKCGDSAGHIVVSGNYTQGANGTLEVEIGGLTQGTQHDWLQVGGTASLNGTMTPSLIAPYVPNVNDTFTFLTAGNVVGSFSSCRYRPPFFYVSQQPTAVHLTRVQPCQADIAPSRTVDIDDLLQVINGWGPGHTPAYACTPDVFPLGGDTFVNVDDLLVVITGWGPCP